jgi:hypothetical protein
MGDEKKRKRGTSMLVGGDCGDARLGASWMDREFMLPFPHARDLINRPRRSANHCSLGGKYIDGKYLCCTFPGSHASRGRKSGRHDCKSLPCMIPIGAASTGCTCQPKGVCLPCQYQPGNLAWFSLRACLCLLSSTCQLVEGTTQGEYRSTQQHLPISVWSMANDSKSRTGIIPPMIL